MRVDVLGLEGVWERVDTLVDGWVERMRVDVRV